MKKIIFSDGKMFFYILLNNGLRQNSAETPGLNPARIPTTVPPFVTKITRPSGITIMPLYVDTPGNVPDNMVEKLFVIGSKTPIFVEFPPPNNTRPSGKRHPPWYAAFDGTCPDATVVYVDVVESKTPTYVTVPCGTKITRPSGTNTH